MKIAPTKICDLGHDARCFAVSADGLRILAAGEQGPLAIVGPDFTILHRIQGPRIPCGVALHPTSNLVAVSNRTSIIVQDGAKRIFEYEHRRWAADACGAVAFVGDGSRLLAIATGDGSNEALLIRLLDGKIVDRAAIDIPDERSYQLVAHPGGEAWALFASNRRDSWSRLLTLDGDRIGMRQIGPFRNLGHGPVSFHPSGGELIVMRDGSLVRFGYPDFGMLGCWTPEEDNFEMHGDVIHIGEGRALVANNKNSQLYMVALESMDVEPVIIEKWQPTMWYYRRWSPGKIVTVHGDYQHNTLLLHEGPPLFA